MSTIVADRRAEARLPGPFSAQVRITSAAGQFTEGVVEDLCVRAARVRVGHCSVEVGDLWLAVVRMSAGTDVQAPRVVVRGRVARIDARGEGSIAVVVQVTQRRWMFAAMVGGTTLTRLATACTVS